jgi:hypothetical protein
MEYKSMLKDEEFNSMIETKEVRQYACFFMQVNKIVVQIRMWQFDDTVWLQHDNRKKYGQICESIENASRFFDNIYNEVY